MEPTQSVARRSRGRWLILFGILLSALTLSGIAASPAMAVTGSTATEAEEFEYFFAGNVTFDDEPLEGVRITVEGNGYDAETETDADGRWSIGVPEKGEYELTLDEDTLPEGVVVEDGQDTVTAEFGLTNRKAVNFFLGEGQRTTTDISAQVLIRVINGLNFGLLLALAAIGLSLIFGTTGLSNFAHAEMVTFGALMVLTFGVDLALPIWLAIIIAIVLSGGTRLDARRRIWKPLRRRGVGLIPLMIVSIGLSLAIRYTYQFFYGGGTRQLPGATIPSDIHLGPVTLSWIDVASMATSIVVLARVRVLPAAHPHRQGDARGLRQPEPRRRERHRRRPRHSHRLGRPAPRSPGSRASCGRTSGPG